MIILCLQSFKVACGLMYATRIPRRRPKPESETPPFTMTSSHIQRRSVLAGPASLVLARPLGEPLSLLRPGSLPWDINQSLDGQLLPQHSYPYSGSGWLTPSQKRWRSSNGLYLGFDVSVMDYNQRNHSISAIDHNVKETALNSL